MNKQKIIRKDGIEYERKPKTKDYNCFINLRYSKEQVEKLKELANNLGVKYQALIKNVLDEYIKKEINK